MTPAATIPDLATSDLSPRHSARLAHILTPPSPQLAKVEALIEAGIRTRDAARAGKAFESADGMRLALAGYDLWECDELYDIATEIGNAAGLCCDGSPIRYLGDRS